MFLGGCAELRIRCHRHGRGWTRHGGGRPCPHRWPRRGCAIEAVGYPDTLLTAVSIVRPGGTVANIGVHGVPVELPMQDMWIRNITITMGLVDTVSIPALLTMVVSGRLPAQKMGTHSFGFDESNRAYDVSTDAAANSALKVIISPNG
jgi:alcohol dehydrogenase